MNRLQSLLAALVPALVVLGAPVLAQGSLGGSTPQPKMLNMQRLACHLFPSRGELALAMMSLSEKTHPTTSYNFRHEVEALLEISDEQKVNIDNGKLRVVVLRDMVSERDRKYTLFRFNLVIDESRSIDNRSLQEARDMISLFFKRLPVAYKAQIIRFATHPLPSSPFINDPNALLQTLNEPRITGGTAFYDAVDQALSEHEHALEEVALQFTVAFTDGQDSTSQRFASFEDFKTRVHRVTQDAQIPIFIAGIGNEINHDLLKQAVGPMGFYMPLDTHIDLEKLFDMIENVVNKTYIIAIPITSSHRGAKTVYLKRRLPSGKTDTVQDVPLPPQCRP